MTSLNKIFTQKQKLRILKERRNRLNILEKQPHKIGVCRKLVIVSPKKPNSAKRKVAKVQVYMINKNKCRFKKRLKRLIFVYIPGQGPHNLSVFMALLIRGGRVRDVPGIRYKLIIGKIDFKPNTKDIRITSRSKYGTKKN